jgi:hypothetical protein
MGLARRVARKSVRRAIPRPVRQAMHPARTARHAVTPRPVKQVSRAAYTARHPVGAAENELIGTALYPPSRRRRRRFGFGIAGVFIGLVLFVVSPWLALAVIAMAIVIPVIAYRRGRH